MISDKRIADCLCRVSQRRPRSDAGDVLLDPCSGYPDFVGTPDSVAAETGEAMQEIGGDRLLVIDPLTWRAISEVTDGLAPALKRCGLLRRRYEHTLFRENLFAF